jgi:GT2 family glycosyltransferase
MQQVSVVIVNWNTGKLLKECLEAISRTSDRSLIRHIVVVDNGSKDTSIQQAQDILPCVFLLQKENLGFAKANNVGITYIQEHGGNEDHILLLNPDTQVHDGAIQKMLSVLAQNPHAGIVGPMLLETTGEIQPSVRSFPSLVVFILLFLKLHRLFSSTAAWRQYIQSDFDYMKEKNVDQVMGAVFLIRNTLIKSLHGLDEQFWIWFEEVDFCKQVKDAGYEVTYTPDAQVMHVKGTSFNQLVGLKKTKPLLDSSLVYARKHVGLGAYILLCILYPVGILIACVASLSHIKQKADTRGKL